MLVYISTFVSPHTLPLGIGLSQYYSRVVFINTAVLTQERKQMGYDVQDPRVEIRNLSEDVQSCAQLILDAKDVILAGDRFDLVQERIHAGKPVFLTSERIFKKGLIKLLDPRTWQMAKFFRSVRNAQVYLLAIGENAAKDFRRLGFNEKNIFRFGYFPKTEMYTYEQLQKADAGKLLWVGRFVDFKRPLMMLRAWKRMCDRCTLTMVGSGKLHQKAKDYAEKHNLQVEFCGNISAEEVKEKMLSHGVLISTSHKGEGWGAVINEGMNRGCAVVCAEEIGCAGTLATNDNAVIFKTNSVKALRNAIQTAISRQKELGTAGYQTITSCFNADVAAERFFLVAQNGRIFDSGVCSKVFQ